MLPPLASRMALRRRAFPSGSPPPERAATVISLMNLVNSFPRLASSAPFLCLILCHFECPDIGFRSYRICSWLARLRNISQVGALAFGLWSLVFALCCLILQGRFKPQDQSPKTNVLRC